MRIKLTIEQSKNSGLTALICVGIAVNEAPGFPWWKIWPILPGEWEAWLQAVQIVAGDPFYGFQPNMGNVRSTRYKNLGYVGLKLCVEYLTYIRGGIHRCHLRTSRNSVLVTAVSIAWCITTEYAKRQAARGEAPQKGRTHPGFPGGMTTLRRCKQASNDSGDVFRRTRLTEVRDFCHWGRQRAKERI